MRSARRVILSLIVPVILSGPIQAQTIVAEEVTTWMFADGEMKPADGLYTVTYNVVGDQIRRTLVANNKTGEITEDNTTYSVIADLLSHDLQAVVFDSARSGASFSGPIMRAIGRPASDAVEILIIGQSFVRSVRSSVDWVVITELKRVRE